LARAQFFCCSELTADQCSRRVTKNPSLSEHNPSPHRAPHEEALPPKFTSVARTARSRQKIQKQKTSNSDGLVQPQIASTLRARLPLTQISTPRRALRSMLSFFVRRHDCH